MPLDKNFLPVDEGKSPDGGVTPVAFYIDLSILTFVQENGPEWKYEDARFLRETIRDPDVIFQNLKRLGEEESFAYSVRLTHDPAENKEPLPPRFGMVFIAFVRLVTGGYLIFDWEWREEDFENPGFPKGFQQDLGSATWKKI